MLSCKPWSLPVKVGSTALCFHRQLPGEQEGIAMRDQGESETAYFKRRFAECSDEDMLETIDDQLREEGYAPEKIRPRKSERRKEIQKRAKNTSTIAVARTAAQLPAEQIVENLPWPMSCDGEVDPAFVAGMKYEAMNVIRGIRLAQELNRMGLEQAKPVIEMAKEMRQAEGQAAQAIASELAQATMQSNQQILGAIHEMAASQGQPSGRDPMTQAFANAAAPIWGQLLQRLFSSFAGMGQQQKHPVQEQSSDNPPQEQHFQPKHKGPLPHMKPGEEDQWTEA